MANKEETTTAHVFHYEGSKFIVVRTDATVDVHYIISPGAPINYMGSFNSFLYGNKFNKKLTEFIDDNIEIRMIKSN